MKRIIHSNKDLSYRALLVGVSFFIVTVSMRTHEVDVFSKGCAMSSERQLLPTADLKQTQLIYVHIAKTGGSTFNRHLEDLLGAQQLDCGNFLGCCDEKYRKLKKDALLSETVRVCGHYSYEETWPLPLDTKQLDNPVHLTHVRPSFWHVLSMLGHDAKAQRFQSYSSRLSNLTAGKGYRLVNFQKSRFPPYMNTSDVIELLTKQFFWVGLTDKYEQSLCLLHFQLGIFDPSRCKHLCTSLANSDSKQESPTLLVPHNVNKGQEHQSLTQREIKLVRDISNEDQRIYEAMLEVFHRRAAIVEERVGFRFANCI
eukprot:CAMPEP_0174577942 /NCGR_PEP_ID=MMETSP0929-20130131/377_1 /TAXON_ID=548131 ORGANISM="Ostreococcus mediterraneus, Strain clade-D-RCC2572" /NCGR_SAMPLE_ID=MMETSP0929 /ASSEMBLY_ACC=CAM_ASM_000573 /LENGTH=312 /DNA_ID=CAMNT_0015758871 /DNA_START=61 /DNA_END=999 /DNA_ORIENTATION=-